MVLYFKVKNFSVGCNNGILKVFSHCLVYDDDDDDDES